MIEQKHYDRLPRVVRLELDSLQRQRDAAVEKLRDYEDAQTPSDIWIEEMIFDSPGSPRTTEKYIQANQVYMKVEDTGRIEDACVSLRQDSDGRVFLTGD